VSFFFRWQGFTIIFLTGYAKGPLVAMGAYPTADCRRAAWSRGPRAVVKKRQPGERRRIRQPGSSRRRSRPPGEATGGGCASDTPERSRGHKVIHFGELVQHRGAVRERDRHGPSGNPPAVAARLAARAAQSRVRTPSRKSSGMCRASIRIGHSGSGECQPCRRASSSSGFSRSGFPCRGFQKCRSVQSDS
jgi:hypothetical protein